MHGHRGGDRALSHDERDKYIIDSLRSSAEPVSGEALALELGMSRVALWKRVESLKAWGYGITASRKGYELTADDGLAGWELDAPGPVVLFDTVGSTMDEARALAASGAPSGTAVLALGQTSGRGRNGGAWESPSGGLYLSVVLRSDLPPSHAGALSLEAAAAALRALGTDSAVPLAFRWPNELVAREDEGPRKVGGILVEAHGDLSAADSFVVGLGLNSAPGRLGAKAARRAEIAAAIVRDLVAWAARPDLDPARWGSLLPGGGPTFAATLWNGERLAFVPAGFSPRGDLRSAGGGPDLSMGEVRSIAIEGEPL